MSTNVFVNGRGVSSKANNNKSIAAMPDVCLSPPSPPAGPIPIPYPNFSIAGKTFSGTKKIRINGKEAGLKEKSNYKSSRGNEAATRSFGMGVVTHTIQGKTDHAAWSFNVKFEGENVIRHMDLTTHNHSSNPFNLASTVDVQKMSPGGPTEEDCEELEGMAQKAAEKDLDENDRRSGALVTAKHTASGKPPSFLKAVAPGDLVGNTEGYCPEPAMDGAEEPKIACTNKRYASHMNKKIHAETKIIQALFPGGKSPGGTLTLRINWAAKGVARTKPCDACKNAICQTAKECDIKIYLCMGENPIKKVEAPCKTRKKGKHYWDGKKFNKALSGHS